MRKITLKEKIRLMLLGIILALILLEVFLRLGGYVLTSANNRRNAAADNTTGQKTYTILCIGESTTEKRGDVSWPEQLQKILKARNTGMNFIVYNRGKGGTNTALMVSELRDALEKYRPDMVITMMGINDGWSNIFYEDSFKFRVVSFLKNFRVYKLGNLIYIHLKNRRNNELLEFEEKMQSNPLGEINLEQGNYAEAEKYFKQGIDAEPENYKNYLGLGKTYMNQDNYSEAEYFYNQALELSPNNKELYWRLGIIYLIYEQNSEAEVNFKKALELSNDGYEQLDLIYQGLLTSLENQGKYDEAEKIIREHSFVMKEMNITNQQKANIENTKYHYQLFYNILQEKRIKLAVMQYPTRNIADFKNFFTEEQQKDIIFIENKDNFNEALKASGYDDLFADKFAFNVGYNFGHCTKKGNSLIAENVADTIFNYLDITS